jgi:hypothetical protein
VHCSKHEIPKWHKLEKDYFFSCLLVAIGCLFNALPVPSTILNILPTVICCAINHDALISVFVEPQYPAINPKKKKQQQQIDVPFGHNRKKKKIIILIL